MLRVAVIACALAGCVQSSSGTCGALLCSSASVCSPAGDRCVLPSQIDACAGKADADSCSYAGVNLGVCTGGVCLPAGCGNGIVEVDSGEVGDDGNRVSLDGCSADCTSDERCGNGIVDYALGEACDCGDGTVAVTGCTMANSNSSGAGCRLGCKLAGCGDGIRDPGEICDDGNNTPGDGCRADCQGRWTEMYSGTYALLQSVWGSSGTDVFAVGEGTILHYDGAAWHPMTVPSTSVLYQAVWGSGPADVYAVGSVGNIGIVDHYDGTAWSNVVSSGSAFFNGVWGTSASDVWFVGGGTAGENIHHPAPAVWTLGNEPSSAPWPPVWTDGPTVWAPDNLVSLGTIRPT